MSCPSCKKRSQVPVPDWTSRLRSLQLLLDRQEHVKLARESGGKVITKDDSPPPYWQYSDEVLEGAVREALALLADKRHQAVAPLDSWQREFLSRPVPLQHALIEMNAEEQAPFVSPHTLESVGGVEGLAELLRDSKRAMFDAPDYDRCWPGYRVNETLGAGWQQKLGTAGAGSTLTP